MLRKVVLVGAAGALISGIAVSPAEAQDTRPWLGWSTNTIELTQATQTALGVAPAALSAYTPFDEPFPQAWADEAVRRSVPLVLSWEPWDWDLPAGIDQPQYSLAGIAEGRHDQYVREWARAAAASGTTILLRFAAEMNGDWHPWSKGETARDFRLAWRHLHRIMAQEGAANVRWVFNPSAEYPGSASIRSFWPGASFVDWLAVDGYNWKGVLPGRPNETVDQVFGETIRHLRAIAPHLPLMFAECGAGPATKAAWLADLVSAAPRLGVRLVIWFEHDKEADWRLATASLPTPVPTLLQQAGWRLAR